MRAIATQGAKDTTFNNDGGEGAGSMCSYTVISTPLSTILAPNLSRQTIGTGWHSRIGALRSQAEVVALAQKPTPRLPIAWTRQERDRHTRQRRWRQASRPLTHCRQQTMSNCSLLMPLRRPLRPRPLRLRELSRPSHTGGPT